MRKTSLNLTHCATYNKKTIKQYTTFCLFMLVAIIFAQNTTINEDKRNTDSLLEQYIKSKGNAVIVFDSTNIKQYWIENSVISQKDLITIHLSNWNGRIESVPLKIQLANVDETQDCKIEVISETKDFGFSINNDTKLLSSSIEGDTFINYGTQSTSFHLEDIQNYSFYLKFNSTSSDVLSIKKIILSFTKNKNTSFLASPGLLKLDKSNLKINSDNLTNYEDGSFSIKGRQIIINSEKSIYTTNNTISIAASVKNTGENPSIVYIGFVVYTRGGIMIDNKNYPFSSDNKSYTVIAGKAGSNEITIDGLPEEYKKGCYLALGAKDDLSDIPSLNLLDEKVVEVKSKDDGTAVILLDKPLKKSIKEGEKIRINGLGGASLYTNVKSLQPNEEAVFSAKILKDDNSLKYSSKAFPRGTYYVKPLILSYSVDSKKDNIILIKELTVNY